MNENILHNFDKLKRISFKHKNNKIAYYLCAKLRKFIPRKYTQKKLIRELSKIDLYNKEYILSRVNYYNKLSQVTSLPNDKAIQVKQLIKSNDFKVYNIDTYEILRYFSDSYKFCPLFGDIINVPNEPSFTKSRPIQNLNSNSVLLKLDKIRHFLFVKDKKQFLDKKNMIVFRGKCYNKPHRIKFLEMYYNHNMCNVGRLVEKNMPADKYIKNRILISEHLDYKFILSLEGNDVASNLKWVMSSNSLAVMPKPKYETWFMEGKLIPNFHYVLIKDDYSDLEDVMNYYIKHPNEALKIIRNAHSYVEQFRNKNQEKLISLMVADKYFKMTT